MKATVTKFKSMAVALKELEPFIRDGQHLKTGKPFKKFGGARSRELLANWLMCCTINRIFDEGRLEFTSDPTGSDGMIFDTKTGECWATEHVIALPNRKTNGDTAILDAIRKKITKGGSAYASGKTLVVFAEGIGVWTPSVIVTRLPEPVLFDAIWIVGLHTAKDGAYAYDVCRLGCGSRPPLQARLTIESDFDSWVVSG